MSFPECKRIPESATSEAVALKDKGWREVEILETYEGEIKNPCRVAHFEDLWRLHDIADKCFVHDRLHVDSLVGTELAKKAKRDYIDVSFANMTPIYVYGTPPLGFCIADLDHRLFLVIKLIGVDPLCQGQGIAKKLIKYALAQTGCSRISAGTQSDNIRAKSLYESFGMSVVRRERTFHK